MGRTRHLPTAAAYNAWAPTYDTDGNMLQKTDDMELKTLLPTFLNLAVASSSPDTASPLRILDLGCGTGRNTAKLLRHPWDNGRTVEVIGIDFSSGMLDVAREKLENVMEEITTVGNGKGKGVTFRLETHDFIPPLSLDLKRPPEPVMPSQDVLKTPVDAVVSTLVLEHFPTARLFFRTLGECLDVGGRLGLVTNMHGDMGGVGGAAGFVARDGEGNGEGKVKIRGQSYVYGVEEVVGAAKEEGFEVVEVEGRGGQGGNGVRERDVSEDMLGELGERGRKWVGVKVWFGMVVRKVR